MSPPPHLIREAMIEAALADHHGAPIRNAAELLVIAEFELLLLVAELDSPTPTTTAERRSVTIRLVAEMSRARQREQDMGL